MRVFERSAIFWPIRRSYMETKIPPIENIFIGEYEVEARSW